MHWCIPNNLKLIWTKNKGCVSEIVLESNWGCVCCYINFVIHWWGNFVQQWDGKRRTHEWLLKEDSYKLKINLGNISEIYQEVHITPLYLPSTKPVPTTASKSTTIYRIEKHIHIPARIDHTVVMAY